MADRTPGSWGIHPAPFDKECFHVISHLGKVGIAWLGNNRDNKPDAQFIAAAPDMEAALLKANNSRNPDEYCACPEYHWDPMDDSHTGFCDAARAALAKARGEEHD